MWWQGPKWLSNESDWPQSEEIYCMYPDGKPIKTNIFIANRLLQNSILSHFQQGNFHSNMRVTAYSLRAFLRPEYPRISKTNAIRFHKDVVSKDELINAKTIAIKTMQRESFARPLAVLKGGKSITKGPMKKWKLYLDDNEIIRCRHCYRLMLSPYSCCNSFDVYLQKN